MGLSVENRSCLSAPKAVIEMAAIMMLAIVIFILVLPFFLCLSVLGAEHRLKVQSKIQGPEHDKSMTYGESSRDLQTQE